MPGEILITSDMQITPPLWQKDWADKPEAINENLGANLLGNRLPIEFNRARPRGWDARFQSQIGGVLIVLEDLKRSGY